MRPNTWLRRRLGLLAAVVLGAAAALAGCSSFSDTVPSCGDPLRLAIIAQSVPAASYLPCLGDLPQGWDASGFNPFPGRRQLPARLRPIPRAAGEGRAHRGVPDCRCQSLPAPAPGVLTYTRASSTEPRFAGRLYDVFPGGCGDLHVRLRHRIADRTDGTIPDGRGTVPQAAAAARPETATRRGAQPMTLLTGGAHEACTSSPALRSPARGRKRCLSGVLADPRVRLGAGAAALLVTAIAAHQDHVGQCEAAAFRAVNGLPGSLYQPAWAVMQLGTFGAAPRRGQRGMAGRGPRTRGAAPDGRHRDLGIVQGLQADGAAAPACGPHRGDARPRPRSRRARVPVRPRRRCRRPGRSRLPPPRRTRAALSPCERSSPRRPDPDICRSPPPT